MDYARVLQFAPVAKATYGTSNGTGGVPVDSWQPVPVERFKASAPDFHATLYQDTTTGKYRVAIAGSDNAGDWTGPNAVLSTQAAASATGISTWNPQMTDAIRFTAEAIKQIRSDYAAANNNAEPSLDYVRSKLDVTGHSLGGALAELVGKFYGIGGANIDGPGVSTLVNNSTFASLKAQVQKELSELEGNYTLAPGQFSAHAFTTVGTTGRHLDDVVSEATPEAYIGDAVIGVGVGIAPVVPLVGAGAVATEGMLLLGHKMDQIINRSRAGLGLPVDGADTSALMGSVDALGNYQPGASTNDPASSVPSPTASSNSPGSTQLPPISPTAQDADMGSLNTSGGDNVSSVSDADLSRPATVFNAATALPGYAGEQGVTVQAGDTVGAIAQRYGMDAGEYKAFLQQQYGAGADLNSIVAGRRLPLPADVYERTQGGVNGLDISDAPTKPQTPGDASGILDALTDAFANADASAAAIKATYGPGVQVADAGNSLPQDSTSNQAPAQADTGPAAIKTEASAASEATEAEPASGTTLSAATSLNIGAATAYAQSMLSAVNLLQALESGNTLSAALNAAGLANTLGHTFGSGPVVSQELTGGLTALSSALNLLDNLQHGNTLGALSSSLGAGSWVANAMAEHYTSVALEAITEGSVNLAAESAALQLGAAGNAMSGAVPFVGVALALESGNPVSMMAAAANFIPGYGSLISIGISLLGSSGLLGGSETPPPPAGVVHFGWDAGGNIDIVVDRNVRGGGDTARHMAQQVQEMLEGIVQTHNASAAENGEQGGNPSSTLALNPCLLPRLSFAGNNDHPELATGVMSIPTWAGGEIAVPLNAPDFAQRVLAALQDNGGLAPAWEVQTQYQHYQQLVRSGASQEDIQAQMQAGLGGGADIRSTQAHALQGNAAESADFKTQSFGTLAVHLDDEETQARIQQAQEAIQTQLTEVLRDVEGDGYLERTQALAATDSAGKLQALLTLDYNGDGIIQTRDILNLGGNKGQDGNDTLQASLATENAALQRNNVQWLDGNGDGVLDARDPAFAAIRLWVDVNQDGAQQGGEAQGLQSLRIQSISFSTGEVIYEDGHRDALTAQTLKADTEGVRATQVQEVVRGEDGAATTQALDAGEVLEHEGYEGQNERGAVRHATFEQQAVRTGDWEGTDEAAAHRHGGGNVDGAPTQTTATGATSQGEVKTQANVTTQRSVSAAQVKQGTQQAAQQGGERVVFVPLGAGMGAGTSTQTRDVTADMIQSLQDAALGGVGGLGGMNLAALTILAAGSTQAAAEVANQATLNQVVRNVDGLSPVSGAQVLVQDDPVMTQAVPVSPPVPSVQTDIAQSSFVPGTGDAGSGMNTGDYWTGGTTVLVSGQAGGVGAGQANGVQTQQGVGEIAVVRLEPVVGLGQAQPERGADQSEGGETQTLPTVSTAPASILIDYPTVRGELIASDEDVVLRIPGAVLVANDSTPNAAADSGQPALRVSAVGESTHGQVSLVGDTVIFTPERNYNGPEAGFSYTVTDQYGLSRTARVALNLAPVNDAPDVLGGEAVDGTEDEQLTIAAAGLLANDSDVDSPHADLSLSRVGDASHGTVSLDANGDVVFTPEANHNGDATFTYWVKDSGGAESAGATATVHLAAVNDAPGAQGESLSGASEDAAFLISAATVLANDHDIDNADGELRLAWVGDAQHGAVSLDASGNVVFTPDANYNGQAVFSYRVKDPAGLESPTVQASLAIAAVNDAPVAVDDQFTTYRNSTMSIGFSQLAGNDTDVDGDALTVSAVRNAVNGSVNIVNGAVEFVPAADFRGAASFEYQTDDGHGGQSWATAAVTVKLPPNLYPTATVSAGGYSDTWYGGSAYYNPVDVTQNFSYQVNDESPGAVTLRFVDRVGNLVSGSLGASTFQYYVYDGWGADGVGIQFDIQLTDQEGIVNTTHVAISYDLGAIGHAINGFATSSDHTGLYISPVVLDLNGDGASFTALGASKVGFDVDADGVADSLAWAGNDDGVLVWDRDHNGGVSDLAEFSFQTLRAGAQTDLEGLQALDTNCNGKLDAGDEKFAEFGVWQDANGNGVTDAGEFRALDAWGIAQIDLRSNGQMYSAGSPLTGSTTGETDVTVMGEAAFTRIDGSTGTVADVMLAYRAGESAASAAHVSADSSAATASFSSDTYAADLARMALLFNQASNTAQTSDAAPLGFVPIQVDVYMQADLLPPQEPLLQPLQAA